MHEVLVNPSGGLSLPRKSVVRFTDRPDMTLDVYRGRKTTMQLSSSLISKNIVLTPFLHFNFCFLKVLISQSKFSGLRKFTLRYQYFELVLNY